MNLPDRPLAGFTGIHPARLGGASCYDYVVLAAEEGCGGAARPPGSTRCCVTTRRRCTAPRPTSTWSRRVRVAVTPLSYDLLDPDLLAELASWDLDLEAIRA